jgi:hypothetical protein
MDHVSKEIRSRNMAAVRSKGNLSTEIAMGKLLWAAGLRGCRNHADAQNGSIKFVQRLLRGPRRKNGWELKQKGGRSLEQIVIDCGHPPFTEDDVLVAKQTLGF